MKLLDMFSVKKRFEDTERDIFALQKRMEEQEPPWAYCIICNEEIEREDDVEMVTAGEGERIIFGPAHWECAREEEQD